MLQDKIQQAILFLQQAERLALKMQPNHGFWLCFSGGKDSQVIYKLAQLAEVKFTAYYNVTTIDPPELVRFIIEKYPDVVRVHPKKTFLRIIKEKGILPTRRNRFCCEQLKETSAIGYCAITGVRASESIRRKKQAALVKLRNKKGTLKKDFEEMKKVGFQCVNGNDKILINPIIDWSEKDVWNFIKLYNLEYCELYDKGFRRLGCLFCPNATEREKKRERERERGFYKNLQKAVAVIWEKNNRGFKNPSDYLDWWFSNKSVAKWQADEYLQLKLNI